MTEGDRAPETVLAEMAPVLALHATQELYREQPTLWSMGENGRARTLEDFGHHFRALQALNLPAFRAHVNYCRDLFSARGLPLRWLDDAWRVMAAVIERDLPPPLAEGALAVLREGIDQRNSPPPDDEPGQPDVIT